MNKYEQIIDGLHPDFKPISDEKVLYIDDESGHYEREFKNTKNGKFWVLRWKVIFGTPETVKTLFDKPLIIG